MLCKKEKQKANDHKIILTLFLSKKLDNLSVNELKTVWRKYFDPSRPKKIHMQFLQTDLYTFH